MSDSKDDTRHGNRAAWFQSAIINLTSEMKRTAQIPIAFIIVVITGAVPAICAHAFSTKQVPATVRQAFRARFPVANVMQLVCERVFKLLLGSGRVEAHFLCVQLRINAKN